MRFLRLPLFVLATGYGSYDLFHVEGAKDAVERYRERRERAEKRYWVAADRLDNSGFKTPHCANFPEERFKHCACGYCRGKVAEQLCREFPYVWCDLP